MAVVAANFMSSTHAEPYSLLTMMAFPHPLLLYPLFTLPRVISHRALLIGLVMVPLYPLLLIALSHIKQLTSLKLTSVFERR
jgi:hypothetical protein